MKDQAPPTNPEFSDLPPALTKPQAGASLVLAGLCSITAIAGIGIALVAGDQPLAMMAGFEAVVLVASLLTIMVATGRLGRDGPALALLCLSGTILISSAFGGLAGGGRELAVGQVSIKGLVLARLALSGGLGIIAAAAALNRPGGSWIKFILGSAFALPVLGTGGLLVLGRADTVLESLAALNTAAKMLAYVGIGLLFTALVAASTQLLVSAFERAGSPKQA